MRDMGDELRVSLSGSLKVVSFEGFSKFRLGALEFSFFGWELRLSLCGIPKMVKTRFP